MAEGGADAAGARAAARSRGAGWRGGAAGRGRGARLATWISSTRTKASSPSSTAVEQRHGGGRQRPDLGAAASGRRHVFVQSGGGPGRRPAAIPQVTLAVEHYNRMVRLIEHHVPVTVELNVAAKFNEETPPNGFNVVGEIPGTDKADEIVMLGAHFDSWHGATGATDNAAGIGRDDGSGADHQGARP